MDDVWRVVFMPLLMADGRVAHEKMGVSCQYVRDGREDI